MANATVMSFVFEMHHIFVELQLTAMLYSLIAPRWFGPQNQCRPLRKAFTSGLGLDALSLAWPAVVQLVVCFNSGSQWF